MGVPCHNLSILAIAVVQCPQLVETPMLGSMRSHPGALIAMDSSFTPPVQGPGPPALQVLYAYNVLLWVCELS